MHVVGNKTMAKEQFIQLNENQTQKTYRIQDSFYLSMTNIARGINTIELSPRKRSLND